MKYLMALFLLAGSIASFAQELYKIPSNIETRLISFENETGAAANGGKENNGAKGHATEVIAPGQQRVLADFAGPGIVQRMWYTTSVRTPEMMRSLRLQIYWDHAAKPAVDVPFGDFFGVGLGQKRSFETTLFSDPEGKAFNCFIPMPFNNHVKIILINESNTATNLFYDISISKTGKHDPSVAYFHAYWNRKATSELGKDFQILPSIKGKGRFLGTNIGVITDSIYKNTWWGEGEVKMYIDEDSQWPTINGTGTEDYAGAAWGINAFNHSNQGCLVANQKEGYYAFYRYHIPDPVYFKTGIKVTIQEMGGADLKTVQGLFRKGIQIKPVIANSVNGYLKLNAMNPAPPITDQQFIDGGVLFYRVDDYSSTAYFYLDKPYNELPPLQPVAERIFNLKEVKP
ncbi:MAG: DUF2961 domain-containing protein [Chitinophagaceae bacterium]|nr:MAG: DUF2961 domain-containing protein [Chitinophagaceae bacterium]